MAAVRDFVDDFDDSRKAVGESGEINPVDDGSWHHATAAVGQIAPEISSRVGGGKG
jgi:hypothetical protein